MPLEEYVMKFLIAIILIISIVFILRLIVISYGKSRFRLHRLRHLNELHYSEICKKLGTGDYEYHRLMEGLPPTELPGELKTRVRAFESDMLKILNNSITNRDDLAKNEIQYNKRVNEALTKNGLGHLVKKIGRIDSLIF